MKTSLVFLFLLSAVCTSLGAAPLDSVSFNLRSHVKHSMNEQELQSVVVVRSYEGENDRGLTWVRILSQDWKPGTLTNGRAFLEKRHIVFWFRDGNAPLMERFSLALELPHQERSSDSYRRGELYQADPVVLQINGYSNIVDFVSSLTKAKAKMDQWMNLALEREITNLVKRIPSISFSISDITDAMSKNEDYYVDDTYGVTHSIGFRPTSYSPLAGLNVSGAFFYTMIIHAKPKQGYSYSERKESFKPFLVLSTEKRYLDYVVKYLESVKGKRVDQFGTMEKNNERLALVSSIRQDSWHELDDGTCVIPEFTTKRIMADTTVLIPKTLISYNDVVKLIPLLNPNSAARELQQLQQQHNKDNSLRKKSNDLFH